MCHHSIRKTAGLCFAAGLVLGASVHANEPAAQDPLDRKVQELREESRHASQATRQAGARGPGESAAVRVLREESREVSRAARQAAVRARNDGTPGMATPDGTSTKDDPKVLGGPAAAGPAERERR